MGSSTILGDLNDPDLIEDMQPPPPVLYHYTSPAAFLQIVKSRRLHATHHRFLNDAGEITFGFEVAIDVLGQLRNELGVELTKLVQDKTVMTFGPTI